MITAKNKAFLGLRWKLLFSGGINLRQGESTDKIFPAEGVDNEQFFI